MGCLILPGALQDYSSSYPSPKGLRYLSLSPSALWVSGSRMTSLHLSFPPRAMLTPSFLLASQPTALVSGTNYAVANYAPQLAKELNLSSTEINLVGTAGNRAPSFESPSPSLSSGSPFLALSSCSWSLHLGASMGNHC